MAMLMFPASAIVLSTIAFLFPAIFLPLKDAIIPFLVVIMFCMGVTLTIDDFKRVISTPGIISLGLILQYSIMPIAALLIANALNLSDELIIGMVLLGASPGGTASNVICYLARGDAALSISLTMASTLLAIAATPYICLFLLDEKVPVPAPQMLLSILKIVILPVATGLVINTLFTKFTRRYTALFPVIAMIAIVIIIAVIVALSQEKIATTGLAIILAVLLHNATGLVAGYYLALIAGYDKRICKTLAIEVGMQNSGLAVALASKYFTAIAALPAAIFSIWHNISGSLLASYWARQNNR